MTSLFSKPPQIVAPPAPPGLIPVETPNAKPGKKSQQQSFISAAAASQLAPAGGSSGKTLLGQ